MTSRHPTGEAKVVPGSAGLPLPIARNTELPSAALATHSPTRQLTAAVTSITLVLVLDVEGLLGLGPAVVLAALAVPVLAVGAVVLLVLAAVWILHHGTHCGSAPPSRTSLTDPRRRV